jgi:hypothetical protein
MAMKPALAEIVLLIEEYGKQFILLEGSDMRFWWGFGDVFLLKEIDYS